MFIYKSSFYSFVIRKKMFYLDGGVNMKITKLRRDIYVIWANNGKWRTRCTPPPPYVQQRSFRIFPSTDGNFKLALSAPAFVSSVSLSVSSSPPPFLDR